MILEQKTLKMSARKWWNHWKGSWKIVLIWKLSSVKYHQWKTQTYKQRKSFSTHLFILNWWKIQISHSWLMKTYTSLHWRTPSIPIWRGRLSSRGILADIFIIFFWERPRKIVRRDLLQPYKLYPQQCTDSFGWHSYRQPWLRWWLLNRLECLSRHQLYLNL